MSNNDTLVLENVPDIETIKLKQIHLEIKDKMLNDVDFSWVSHHLESCNLFYNKGISKLFKEHNPIQTFHEYNDSIDDYKYKCRLFLGGKNADKIYYGKPIIYENSNQKFMYPNEARLKNMNYSLTLHIDVDVEYEIYNKDLTEKTILEVDSLEKIFFGKFPIMLKSNLCILESLTNEMCYSLGECKQDYGGYFIIDGKEKVIIPQEKFANNMIYSRQIKDDASKYDFSIEIRSISEDSSKPQRTLKILRELSIPSLEKNFFVVDIPNVRKPVPFFILMRALGFNSDKEIIEACLLNLDENENYLDYFRTSVHDAGSLFTQNECLKYIGSLTKGKTEYHAHKILCDFLLPHLGEKTYKKKGYFLGYMLFDLIQIINGEKETTDRDHFKYKRVETSGDLMFQLFNEYLNLQYKNIYQKIDKEYYYHEGVYSDNYTKLVETHYTYFFEDRLVEDGFRKAFKGNWGAFSHTKRDGAVQDLNRLSYNSFLSHLRKVNLPFDSSAKVTGPRLCHGSQYGIIDPIDTPDGGNVGLHKHLTVASRITTHIDPKFMLHWLDKNINIYYLGHVSNNLLDKKTKLFINGSWIGVVDYPLLVKEKILSARRIGLIPYFISFSFIINEKKIDIYTDGGRLIRPTFYTINEKTNPKIVNSFSKTFISYQQSESLMNLIKKEKDKYSWFNCITGFVDKKKDINPINNNFEDLFIPNISDLYDNTQLNLLNKREGIIDYLDSSESESCFICSKIEHYKDNKRFTHVDIDPSFLLGIMTNQIVFPEHNPLPRDLFGCGQAKQAASLFHSNFNHRIDKMGINLNYGQQPILRSSYLKYIQNNRHPHGENPIVAIMCYTSYNVEDAILFNEASLKRGIFRTTYYNMYETHEETNRYKNNVVDSKITNIFNENIERTKPGYDYNYLDDNGLIKENVKMHDKLAVIGKISYSSLNPNEKLDTSIFPKKGQLGFVDKTYISDDDEGRRMAKIRIREERIPAIGDKFCSRCGQKGTIGNIIPERDMSFTKDGIRPDIIINPHAIPSRMTIGQLIESIIGKTSVMLGAFADCTAFMNLKNKYKSYGDILTKQMGYHSKGSEVLYNGMTGEQIESNIFIGPTYYMRLKHMVKDKINYRSKGPRTALTRQTVQGRANDGGLRVGEMERDCIITHGASAFLRESMMERGDKYKIAICNKTGALAIHNPFNNLYMSPQVDGPIEFNIENNNNVQLIQKTHYGHDFSIVEIPYAFKILMQELMACNIQMKIITEDNIDQLTNVLYSGKKVNLKDIESKLNENNVLIEKQKAFFEFGDEETKLEPIDEDEEKQPEEDAETFADLDKPEEVFVSPNIESEIKLNDDEDDDEDEKVIELPQDLRTEEYLPWKYIRNPEDNTYMYVSLIIDNNGDYDIWAELEPPIPDKYPENWNHKIVSKYNLDEKRIIELLKQDQTNGNWSKVIKQLIKEKQANAVIDNANAVVANAVVANAAIANANANAVVNAANILNAVNANNTNNNSNNSNNTNNSNNNSNNNTNNSNNNSNQPIGGINNILTQGQQQLSKFGNIAGDVAGNLANQGQAQLNTIKSAATNIAGQGQNQLSSSLNTVQGVVSDGQQQMANTIGQITSNAGNLIQNGEEKLTETIDKGTEQGQVLLSKAQNTFDQVVKRDS